MKTRSTSDIHGEEKRKKKKQVTPIYFYPIYSVNTHKLVFLNFYNYAFQVKWPATSGFDLKLMKRCHRNFFHTN